LRKEHACEVAELRREGLQTVVLTGDRRSTAEFLKTELQLDDVRAELKPEQKVAAIRSRTAAAERTTSSVTWMCGSLPSIRHLPSFGDSWH